MKLNNYDKIADYYDAFSRLIFFRAQVNAQLDQLPSIPASSKLLLIGGGTGWILDELSKIHSSGLEITYVEISGNMLKRAKKRNLAANKTEFIHLPIEEFVTEQSYDVILTAFLFDNFSKDRISQVFSKLNHLLRPGGLWLFSDFEYDPGHGKKWQWLLLKSMYLFFRSISNVEATALIPTDGYFKNKRYQKVMERTYYNGFIKAIVYKKSVS